MRRELWVGPTHRMPAGESDQYELRVKLAWARTRGPLDKARSFLLPRDSAKTLRGGVEGVAWALHQCAAAQALTVRVSDTRRYVVLSRT